MRMSMIAFEPIKVGPGDTNQFTIRPQYSCKLQKLHLEQRRELSAAETEIKAVALDALEESKSLAKYDPDRSAQRLRHHIELMEPLDALIAWQPASDFLVEVRVGH